MKTLYNIISNGLITLFLLFFFSCSKEWLNEKPAKNLVVPETIKDFQAILDNANVINNITNTSTLASSPYIYVSDNTIGEFQEFEREMYTWQKTIHYSGGGQNFDWNNFFTIVESANIVFDGLNNLNENSPEINDVKGQAYFIRAFCYYHLAQSFCKQFAKETVSDNMGLPLRTTSDVNQNESRSSLKETFDFIISDLQLASSLLPSFPTYYTRASKLSALAMLAKVNLIKQEYDLANLYADSVIQLKPDLIDFNNTSIVNNSNSYKFNALGAGNKEIIWFAKSGIGYFETSYLGSRLQVDPIFYNSYNNNDLRKQYFYGLSGENVRNFAGSYTGDNAYFQGISTNEMYFIRSECYARTGKLEEARADLNLVLSKRYRTGTAPIITENNPDLLLSIILEHRTKEFPRFSNIWWEDARRLNLDPRFQKTFTRVLNGETFQIAPNDSRYVFQIPEFEIILSGLEQNER